MEDHKETLRLWLYKKWGDSTGSCAKGATTSNTSKEKLIQNMYKTEDPSTFIYGVKGKIV